MLHTNPYEDEFLEFRESSYFEILSQKFKPLPYYKKYKRIKQIVFCSSYLFNVVSAITATSLIFLFIYTLTDSKAASFAVSATSVIIIEIMKRKLSRLVFKEWLMAKKYYVLPLLVLILISFLSVLSSFYGAREIVVGWSKLPPMEAQDISHLQDELKNLDTQIEAARNTTWKGVTTEESQATIQVLSEQRASIVTEMMRLQQQNDLDNRQAISQHESSTQLQAKHFALVTLLLEVLFWIAAYYLEYYDFRSYIEFYKPLINGSKVKDNTVDSTELGETENMLSKNEDSPDIDPSILKAAIKNAKANLSAYKGKLKSGQGTVTSNNRGIRRWQKRLQELEDMLPDKIPDKNEEIIPDKGSDNGVATLF